MRQIIVMWWGGGGVSVCGGAIRDEDLGVHEACMRARAKCKVDTAT